MDANGGEEKAERGRRPAVGEEEGAGRDNEGEVVGVEE